MEPILVVVTAPPRFFLTLYALCNTDGTRPALSRSSSTSDISYLFCTLASVIRCLQNATEDWYKG